MKVLGLVASARKLGNSEILVKEILSALPEDTEKTMLRLTELDIRQCNACYACLPEDKTCVIQDDFAFFLDAVKAADAIVLAVPCYFLGTQTSLKLLNDRFISVLHQAKEFAGKPCVIAVTYGIPGWQGYAREAAVNFARFLHLDVLGTMLVNAASPGEVVVPEVLQQARGLGSLLLSGKPAEVSEELLRCRDCGSTLLQILATGEVRCRMCGLSGKIQMDGDRLELSFDQPKHPRFSPEGMSEHAKVLEAVKQQFIMTRQELNKLRKPYQEMNWWIKPERQ